MPMANGTHVECHVHLKNGINIYIYIYTHIYIYR